MGVATKPTIPYYAQPEELPAPLPTVEEIFAAAKTSRISYEWFQTTVVRIREHYAVKFGSRTSVQEGMNMLFVAQSTRIPVPKVYAIFEHEHEGHPVCFIVMEYVVGQTLLSVWNLLSRAAKRATAAKLRAYMDELRSLPSPGYYGSLWEGPYRARELTSYTDNTTDNSTDNIPHPEPDFRGPYKTEEEFCDALWEAYAKSLPAKPAFGPEARARALKHWRRIYRAYFKGDGTPVFTHGDFERVNVIVADDGRLVMIDWEYSGWYPKFWESCRASLLLDPRDDWGDSLAEILGTDYDAQFPLLLDHWHLVCMG